MKEITKVHAKSRVGFGLKQGSPRGGERQDLDNMIPGSKVLVYRKKS